ncbi:MAG: sensor histidine kinase [Lachnospiraceae bacterium]|nr:sensor histidine kinase [Lachnospiraceae bacterium]
MADKNDYYVNRIRKLVMILMGVITFLVGILLCWIGIRDIVSAKLWIMISVATVMSLGIIWTVLEEVVWKPYNTYQKLFRDFVTGQIYKELLEKSVYFFPNLREALLRFDDLVDRNKAIQLSTKQAEFLALQNQINPHFLYNTLDAIRGDALCAGMDNIADITEALSTFFRYTITETGNLVTLEDELENVDNYFKIQQYRFGEKLNIRINVDEKSEILQLQCPKLMLQPVVENAIFHGLEKKSEGGTISIDFEACEYRVLINVKDDGVGIEEETLNSINQKLDHISMGYIIDREKHRSGIALNNVCRRIKLLFGEEYGIHVYSIKNIGTHVCISLPIIKKDK